MHILYASVPSNWEVHNIPPQLATLGKVTTFYLKDSGINPAGPFEKARAQLDRLFPSFVESLHSKSPIDLVLSYLSGAFLSPPSIEKVKHLGIPTVGFHLDDRLSFRGQMCGDQWTGPAAVCTSYDLNLTNATASLVKYHSLGSLAIFWPEAANPEHFKPLDLPQDLDVTF
ncbi:MAG: hypothetical protein KDD43_14795, partial [Bdellovibrionales bacterium]|nr:hypothetical protein [Bdellovibrionales bacterium]